jgi:hypothetical protein
MIKFVFETLAKFLALFLPKEQKSSLPAFEIINVIKTLP